MLLQKRLLPRAHVRILRRHAGRLVYDFDDAVLFRSPRKGSQKSLTRARRFSAIVGAADLVIAGNDYLRRLAEPYARRVRVLPSALDPAKYERAAAASPRDEKTVTLGWIGSRSTLRYLLSIHDALARVVALCPHVRLVLVCDEFPDFRQIPALRKVWREAEEAEDVAGFDIALAPVGDDPWSLGKCGLKLLQYFAASRPVVCSPFGVHKEFVRDGTNGFWACSTEEWVDRLMRLIASPEDRRRMGAAGRAILEERYTLTRTAPAFLEAVTGSTRRAEEQQPH